MVPELLVRGEANDFQGMLALATIGESASENMSTGMQLSVICAEDAPRIAPGDAERETAGTLFARHLLTSRLKPCEFWPAGTIPASYYEPVISEVPALVLSGDVDPVTPPTWGAEVSAHLSRAPARDGAGHRSWRARHRLRPAPGGGLHRAGQRRWPRYLVRDIAQAAAVLPDPRGSGPRRRPGGREVIRVEGLRKQFGSVTAVDDVSFVAPDGAVTGLLGPNGAGKTTTLRMLYALMRPDAGRIHVDDVDAVADPQGAQARLGVLPDVSGLYPRLTAREHIHYYGELQGVSGAALRSRTEELLNLLDMAGIADRRTAGFSHGERTKVALARALVHNPRNVLLDEPTNGLDVMSTRAVREIIRRLRGEGRTVVFSSHVMQEVSALCDTIIVIAHGRIVASGSPDALRAQTGHANLEDAFVALAGLERAVEP